MRRSTRRRIGVPSEEEAALLQVCFLPAAEAAQVWDERASRISIDALEPESHGLLPLLHRRLLELDRHPPSLDRLAGVRRRLWAQNEVRMRSVHSALAALATAGVPGALIGGAAVLASALERVDLRPLHDVEVLVPSEVAMRAADALVDARWVAGPRWRSGYLLDIDLQRFTDLDNRSLTLCSSAAPPYDDAVDLASSAQIAAGSFAVVTSGDLLAHTVLDGARAMKEAGVRWASDALAVLLGRPDVDWARLARTVNARHGGSATMAALAQLHRVVPLSLPTDLPQLLSGPPRRRWERALGADAAGRTTVLRAHVRRSAGLGLAGTTRALPEHLCESWHVSSVRRLPTEAIRRALGAGRAS